MSDIIIDIEGQPFKLSEEAARDMAALNRDGELSKLRNTPGFRRVGIAAEKISQLVSGGMI